MYLYSVVVAPAGTVPLTVAVLELQRQTLDITVNFVLKSLQCARLYSAA